MNKYSSISNRKRTMKCDRGKINWIRQTILSVVILTLTGNLLFADQPGQIRGRIKDNMSKEYLAGVNIVVTGMNLGASSDKEGKFLISGVPLGSQRLEISYIGYKTQVLTDIMVMSNKPAIVNIEMVEQAFEGEAITVTAGYFADEEQVQPSRIGLTREEIRRYPGGFEDVVRTVSTLPGVAVAANGGRNDLLVRGGGPSENLYIVNNIEIPNINHFGTQGTSSGSLSFINLDFVEKVKFSTGGFNAQYGDKMSSVLELELTEGRKDRVGGKALISATQFGLNLEGPVSSKGDFIFSVRKSYLDLIFNAAGLPFVPVYYDANFIVNYELTPKDRISFLGLGAWDFVDRNINTLENRVRNSGLMDNTQNQFVTGIDYRHLVATGYWGLTLNFNLNQYRFSQGDIAGVEYFSSNADENELALKVKRFWSPAKTIHFIAGGYFRRIDVVNTTSFADTIYNRSGNKIPISALDIPANNRINAISHKAGFFGEAEWHLTNRFNVDLGLRMDYYAYLKDSWTMAPRLSFSYLVTSDMELKGSTGLYYQAPSYVWMNNAQNENLKSLRNWMTIIGLSQKWSDDIRVSLEGYFKRYDDLPTGITPGVNDYLVITNTGTTYGGNSDDFQSFGYFPMVSEGTGESYGLELFIQKRYSDIPLYGQLSLTIGEAKYTAYNGKIYFGQYDQRVVFNLSGGYKLNDKWEFSGKFRYFTGIPYTPVYVPDKNPVIPGEIQNLPEEYLTARLDAGHHLDIRVDRYFFFDKWSLIVFLDVQNIYNYKIPQRPTYNFWDKSISNTPGIGILPSLGISLGF